MSEDNFIEHKPKIRTDHSATDNIGEDDDDQVVAEFDVVLLRSAVGCSVDRFIFEQSQPARMINCNGQLKANVKHVELNMQSRNNADVTSSLYDGTYTSESHTLPDEPGRDVLGFFNEGRLYVTPIESAYLMSRKIERQEKEEDDTKTDTESANKHALAVLAADANGESPASTVIRAKFSRQETDWQKKRREQSYNHRQQIADADSSLTLQIGKEDIRTVFVSELHEAKYSHPAAMKLDVQIPEL